jgi:hypothetical protein
MLIKLTKKFSDFIFLRIFLLFKKEWLKTHFQKLYSTNLLKKF